MTEEQNTLCGFCGIEKNEWDIEPRSQWEINGKMEWVCEGCRMQMEAMLDEK